MTAITGKVNNQLPLKIKVTFLQTLHKWEKRKQNGSWRLSSSEANGRTVCKTLEF
jgi:hypothetical protein